MYILIWNLARPLFIPERQFVRLVTSQIKLCEIMFPPKSFPLYETPVRAPSRGLGTIQVDAKDYPEKPVKQSVLQALQIGHRYIDAALGYEWGSVERSIEQATKESGVPRDELIIVSKP